jgi:nicotinate-nucleotide pyrophosphorylase (carboxylating)
MQTWCTVKGPARALLTGERTALNFAQALSGTATATRAMIDQIAGTRAQLLDTRKTLPGMRAAQKYAVRCGGGVNHRMGLYDGILVKENHIRAAGSIANAIDLALKNPKGVALVEIEVENLSEFSQALDAGAKRILLDNFSNTDLEKAVALNNGQVELEASGNVNLQTIKAIAGTGVNFISCGQITKDIKAIDLSLQFST